MESIRMFHLLSSIRDDSLHIVNNFSDIVDANVAQFRRADRGQIEPDVIGGDDTDGDGRLSSERADERLDTVLIISHELLDALSESLDDSWAESLDDSWAESLDESSESLDELLLDELRGIYLARRSSRRRVSNEPMLAVRLRPERCLASADSGLAAGSSCSPSVLSAPATRALCKSLRHEIIESRRSSGSSCDRCVLSNTRSSL